MDECARKYAILFNEENKKKNYYNNIERYWDVEKYSRERAVLFIKVNKIDVKKLVDNMQFY